MLDLSQPWHKINPNVIITKTKKKFYGEYVFKINLFIKGTTMWILRNKAYLNIDSLEDLQEWTLSAINKGRLNKKTGIIKYRSRLHPYANNNITLCIDTNRLWSLIQIKQKHQPTRIITTSTSHPDRVIIFSNDQALLFQILLDLNMNVADTYSKFREVSVPNTDDLASLNAGNLLLNKANKFKYRCSLKKTTYSTETHQQNIQLMNYLTELQHTCQIEVPEFVFKTLSGLNSFAPSMYFYCNDKNIITFLNIIKPNCVSGVQPIALPSLIDK